jgi:hypothetical protein
MFINCPYCRALVATDLATDLPPQLCPECKGPLRDSDALDLGAPATLAQNGAADASADASGSRDVSENSRLDDSHPDDASMRDGSEAITPSDAQANATLSIAIDEATFAMPKFDEPGESDDSAESLASPAQALSEDLLSQDQLADHVPSEQAPPVHMPLEPPTSDRSELASKRDIAALSPATHAAQSRTTTRRRAGQTTPSFARARERTADTPHARAWPAIAAIVGLSGLLILQMLLADRARLAGDARWRPLVQTLCSALSCDLPPWREPAAFTLVQRDVRQHPTALGALRVTASFRNDARWPQPWPTLELTLSDVNGRPSGQRGFEAREYLGGAPSQQALASGETATVAMDIIEPAAQIVAYDIRFR